MLLAELKSIQRRKVERICKRWKFFKAKSENSYCISFTQFYSLSEMKMKMMSQSHSYKLTHYTDTTLCLSGKKKKEKGRDNKAVSPNLSIPVSSTAGAFEPQKRSEPLALNHNRADNKSRRGRGGGKKGTYVGLRCLELKSVCCLAGQREKVHQLVKVRYLGKVDGSS